MVAPLPQAQLERSTLVVIVKPCQSVEENVSPVHKPIKHFYTGFEKHLLRSQRILFDALSGMNQY